MMGFPSGVTMLSALMRRKPPFFSAYTSGNVAFTKCQFFLSNIAPPRLRKPVPNPAEEGKRARCGPCSLPSLVVTAVIWSCVVARVDEATMLQTIFEAASRLNQLVSVLVAVLVADPKRHRAVRENLPIRCDTGEFGKRSTRSCRQGANEQGRTPLLLLRTDRMLSK